MPPFLRIAINAYEAGDLPAFNDLPVCAIRLKDSINTGMFACKALYRQESGALRMPHALVLKWPHLLGSGDHKPIFPLAFCCFFLLFFFFNRTRESFGSKETNHVSSLDDQF